MSTRCLDPNGAVAWNNKGNALGHLMRYDEALVAWGRALALDPNDAYAWNNKGSALRTWGRMAEAKEAERRAQELGG